ncbi:MAG: MarR family transcriptional regulator [Proteobacteria bacterium]|nr:MarR family transcriptional regulator [Pseudomonadota bacterium]
MIDRALGAIERLVEGYHLALREALEARPPDLSRPEARLLLAAALAEGRPMKDLAREMGLSRPSVSLTADSLVAKGYLARRTGADRRETLLGPTMRGWEVVGLVRSRLVRSLGLSDRTEAELREFAELCFKNQLV